MKYYFILFLYKINLNNNVSDLKTKNSHKNFINFEFLNIILLFMIYIFFPSNFYCN